MMRKVTKLSKYGVEVRVELWTTFEADSEHDALEQANEWVTLEYGSGVKIIWNITLLLSSVRKLERGRGT